MFALKKMITAAALTFAALSTQAATLTFSAPIVTNGSSVDVNVLISDVTDLSIYSLNISYDASLLALTGVNAGSFMGSADSTDFFVAATTTGLLSGITGLTFEETGISGSGGLISLHFNTLGAGSAFLNFSDLMFLNSDPSGLGDIAVTGVNALLTILPVVVTPPTGDVPEPASALLLGVGAAAFIARRRKAVAAPCAA